MKNVNKKQLVIISGNSIGLENDAFILQSALKKNYPNLKLTILLGRDGFFAKAFKLAALIGKKVLRRELFLVHMEELQAKLLWLGKKNYLIPNQEWFRSHTEKSMQKNPEVVLFCKTQDALECFADFSARRYFLSFASIDRYQPLVKKQMGKFLHLAGKSQKKGSLALIAAWKKRPDWPCLSLKTSVPEHIQAAKNIKNIKLITQNLNQTELEFLMNNHGVHLCISEMEGFGHYISEALSTGAIVLTTNAAPMNEMVSHEFGFLIKAEKAYQQYRATAYQISEHDLAKKIDRLLAMPEGKLKTMSQKARAQYQKNAENFSHNVKSYFDLDFSL